MHCVTRKPSTPRAAQTPIKTRFRRASEHEETPPQTKLSITNYGKGKKNVKGSSLKNKMRTLSPTRKGRSPEMPQCGLCETPAVDFGNCYSFTPRAQSWNDVKAGDTKSPQIHKNRRTTKAESDSRLAKVSATNDFAISTITLENKKTVVLVHKPTAPKRNKSPRTSVKPQTPQFRMIDDDASDQTRSTIKITARGKYRRSSLSETSSMKSFQQSGMVKAANSELKRASTKGRAVENEELVLRSPSGRLLRPVDGSLMDVSGQGELPIVSGSKPPQKANSAVVMRHEKRARSTSNHATQRKINPPVLNQLGAPQKDWPEKSRSQSLSRHSASNINGFERNPKVHQEEYHHEFQTSSESHRSNFQGLRRADPTPTKTLSNRRSMKEDQTLLYGNLDGKVESVVDNKDQNFFTSLLSLLVMFLNWLASILAAILEVLGILKRPTRRDQSETTARVHRSNRGELEATENEEDIMSRDMSTAHKSSESSSNNLATWSRSGTGNESEGGLESKESGDRDHLLDASATPTGGTNPDIRRRSSSNERFVSSNERSPFPDTHRRRKHRPLSASQASTVEVCQPGDIASTEAPPNERGAVGRFQNFSTGITDSDLVRTVRKTLHHGRTSGEMQATQGSHHSEAEHLLTRCLLPILRPLLRLVGIQTSQRVTRKRTIRDQSVPSPKWIHRSVPPGTRIDGDPKSSVTHYQVEYSEIPEDLDTHLETEKIKRLFEEARENNKRIYAGQKPGTMAQMLDEMRRKQYSGDDSPSNRFPPNPAVLMYSPGSCGPGYCRPAKPWPLHLMYLVLYPLWLFFKWSFLIFCWYIPLFLLWLLSFGTIGPSPAACCAGYQSSSTHGPGSKRRSTRSSRVPTIEVVDAPAEEDAAVIEPSRPESPASGQQSRARVRNRDTRDPRLQYDNVSQSTIVASEAEDVGAARRGATSALDDGGNSDNSRSGASSSGGRRKQTKITTTTRREEKKTVVTTRKGWTTANGTDPAGTEVAESLILPQSNIEEASSPVLNRPSPRKNTSVGERREPR